MKKIALSFIIIALGCVQAQGQLLGYNPSYYFIDITSGLHQPSLRVDADTCRMLVVYRYEFIRDTIKMKKWHEKFALQIGDKVSRYYSIYAEKADSIQFGSKVPVNPTSWAKDNDATEPFHYYMNYPRKGWLTYQLKIMGKVFQYIEPIPKQRWKILPGERTILGHRCLTAQTTFRGRTYKVWYAPDIKESMGPWKFSGLPGLILQAEDTKRFFVFTAISLRKGRVKEKIYLYKHKVETITRAQMAAKERKFYTDPIALMKESGLKTPFYMKGPKGTLIELKPGNIRYPKIPEMELE